MPPEKPQLEINGLRVVETILGEWTSADRKYVTQDGRVWESLAGLSDLSKTGIVIGTLRKTK